MLSLNTKQLNMFRLLSLKFGGKSKKMALLECMTAGNVSGDDNDRDDQKSKMPSKTMPFKKFLYC